MSITKEQTAYLKLIARIQEIFPMTDEEEQVFTDRITVKEFKKGSVLISEGQIIDKAFFIIEGLVRQYTLSNDKDKSVFFYIENQMIRLLGKDSNPGVSSYYLECLEDSIICVAYSRPDDEEFIQKYPRFQTLCLILMEDIFKQNQDILEDFIHLTPLERYQMLLENRPELVQRIPQQYLASYLGYTPESLSRIKKRIFEKEKP